MDNEINALQSLLAGLGKLAEEKGVPKSDDIVSKNIIKSPNSTFDSSERKKGKLTSDDKQVLEESYTLFNELFFSYQDKLQKPTKAQVETPIANKESLMKEFALEQMLKNKKSSPIEDVDKLSNTDKVGLDLDDVFLKKQYKTFIELFFEYQKKNTEDKSETTKVATLTSKKLTPPPLPKEKSEGGSSLLGGLGLAALSGLIGLAGLVYGLMSDGPLKGLSKILSKLGIGGAIKMIERVVGRFVAIVADIFKFPMKLIDDFAKGGVGVIKKILPKAGKGILGKLTGNILKVIKPGLKLLKRVPVLGTLISVGFAISRFSSGDTVGGIIDVLSGLVGLLDMVAPGLGFSLSLGLDLFNAFLDVKAGGSNPEASAKKLDIIGNMAKTLGSWIWDNALRIPVLGTVKRFGMAWESFTGGNLGEGLKQIALGLFSIIPGGGLLIEGFEVLHGWLTSKDDSNPQFNSNKSWMDKIKDWIKSKLQNLPWAIKKALSFFGIVDDDVETPGNMGSGIESAAKKSFDSVKGFIGSAWDNMKGPIGDSLNTISEFSSGIWEKTKDLSSKAWETTKSYMSDVWTETVRVADNTWETIKEKTPMVLSTIGEMSKSMFDKVSSILNDVLNNLFGIFEGIKTKMSEWIPKIIDSISAITDGAVSVIKSLGDKIGSWISGIFGGSEKPMISKESEISKIQEKETLIKESNIVSRIVVDQNYEQNLHLKVLYTASLKQIDLLANISNISQQSLQELKRLNFGGQSTSQTTVVSPQQSSKSTEKVNMSNNRSGYIASPYALG